MKLSIITINYNDIKGLQKTFKSVFEQTYSEIEYIVIDGGSTDGSKELIEQHSAKIAHWVSEKDKGIYNAMNKGIKAAKGEYLLFLNSGDWLVSDLVIEKVFTENFSEDIIYGNVLKVLDNSKDSEQYKGLAKSDLTLKDLYNSTLPHQSAFISKSLFDKYGLYSENYKLVSDWVFFLRTIGVEGASVKYFDLDISYYDIGGVSSLNEELRFKEKQEAQQKEIPAQIYPDYKYMADNQFKIEFYEKLTKITFLWGGVRFFNKIFKLHLWDRKKS